jgi:hypothetical protein
MGQDERLSRWQRAELMDPDRILLREIGVMTGTLGEKEQQSLQDAFNSVSFNNGGVKYMDENGFMTLFASNTAIPIQDFAEAVTILFESLIYLSNYPFKKQADNLLTFDSFVRALFWILPERSNGWFEFGSHTRARTDADKRRILFQGLANNNIGHDEPLDEQGIKSNVRRRAWDVEEHLLDIAAMNYDSAGDEIYHDILDVLYHTPVEPLDDTVIPVARDEYRPLATSLHQGQVRLRELIIPCTRFRTFVEFALHLLFQVTNIKPRLPKDYTDAAEDLTKAFSHNNAVGVSWETFDAAFIPVAVCPF